MIDEASQSSHADAGPVERPVVRQVPEACDQWCGDDHCLGVCGRVAVASQRRKDGMPTSADERHLRRLLAARVAMPHAYYDDGEAYGHEHGISIDFMREPVADIDAKLRALNVARAECSKAHNVEAQARAEAAGRSESAGAQC